MSKNILLVTGDHTRHDALACNLDARQSCSLAQVVKTPNFDRLASEGVTFRNSFTPNPICVPGRASITTGNYSHKCTGSKSNGGRIRDDQPKLAEHFAQAGYATYAIGKLHYVPYSPPGEPRLLHGFEVAELNEEGRMIGAFDPLGKLEGIEDYHDYLERVGWAGYERAHGIGNNDVHPSPSPVPAEYHEEAWVAERSIARLEEHLAQRPGQPFLMWSSFSKPHSPYDPPRPYDSLYDPREMPIPLGGWENGEIMNGRDPEVGVRRYTYGWQKLSEQAVQVIRAYYCAMMTFQDKMLGRLLDFLEAAGLAEETIVVYTADHGDLLGDLGRFFKSCMYDASVKVPMLWRAPGVIPGDATHEREQLAGLQDVLPTLCALTGAELGCAVDGVDLTPVLREPQAPGRDYYVSQTGEPPCQKYMVRTAEWKYMYSQIGGIEELYDVNQKNYEATNLARDSQFAAARDSLRQTLVDWCTENEDEKMLDGGRLAVSGEDVLPAPEFAAGRMGWRKY